ncbi:ATP-binding protein [Streptosporangium roseum]|uniref:ATP-binding protein n=1 Tax=Streptosporangium roseum TaxID=2001 RepID=UPI00332B908D
MNRYARFRHRLRTTVLQLGERAARPPEEPPAPESSWSLPPEPFSVPRARRLVRARLTEWGLEEQSEIAELLVSELVTNALDHARGAIRLTLCCQEGLLRCEVEDAHPVAPRMRRAGDDDENGRGLYMLDLLSCCWGSDRTPAGKVVWFELPVDALSEDCVA